jgi:hypothetical protein
MDHEAIAKRFERFAIEHDEMAAILAQNDQEWSELWRNLNAAEAEHQREWARYCRLKAMQFRERMARPCGNGQSL